MRPADFGHRYMDRVDHAGWWMFVGMVLVVGLWSLLVWLVISTFRRGTTPTTTGGVPPTTAAPAAAPPTSVTASAEQILAERLARGEIDPDDYRHRLDTLRNTSFGASGSPSSP